jgi:hypothetical protein
MRGNHSPPVFRHHPEDPREETTGSLSRPGRTATASFEKPALGQFPESLRAAAVDASNVEPVFLSAATLVPDFPSSRNRLVRARMLGGVGAGRGNPPGYPMVRPAWA